MKEEIFCSVCGESNKLGSNFCSSCGVSLKHISTPQPTDLLNSDEQKTVKSFSRSKSKEEKTGKILANETVPKEFSNKKLVYLVFSLVFIAIVIVYFSGMFDNHIDNNSVQTTTQNNPHAGVDLNSLKQITELEKTVADNPKDKESLLHLAHLLNDSGFKEKAIDRYKEYLLTDPKNADVWVDMGVCYYETKKNPEAISAMEKALRFQPLHQIAHLNLGIVNIASGNRVKAESYLKKAIEINPTNDVGQKAKELLNSH
jgi:Tfp pilus assembly protein PilF